MAATDGRLGWRRVPTESALVLARRLLRPGETVFRFRIDPEGDDYRLSIAPGLRGPAHWSAPVFAAEVDDVSVDVWGLVLARLRLVGVEP